MTDHPSRTGPAASDPIIIRPLDPALAARLRGLAAGAPPATDLWPGIAARLPPRVAATAVDDAPAASRGRGPHLLPWAMAASVILAVGLGWQLRPGAAVTPPPASLSTASPPAVDLLPVATHLQDQYQAALRELPAATTSATGIEAAPVLAELDQAVDSVLGALALRPDSKHLIQQLQRLQARRLSLTRRLIAA